MAQATITAVRARRVLNSHLDWTLETTIELADGRSGRGAAPKGETPSIYEESGRPIAGREGELGEAVAATLVGRTVDQAGLDEILAGHREDWGAALLFALSVAFYEATLEDGSSPSQAVAGVRPPRLLFNLLNAGLHAYTNPVVADVTEVLLMPRDDDLARSIDGYRRLLDEAREVLAERPTRLVGANQVHDLGAPAGDPSVNDRALDLARTLLDRTGLSQAFELAIDASAGDWSVGERYTLPVSGVTMERDELVDWWLGLIARNDLRWLEDPFAETDRQGWRLLHDRRPEACRILGDNLTSTLPDQLALKAPLVDGVLLKPDQNGTVSGSRAFAALARERGLALITSHRSIETDSPFLVHLSREIGADAIKVGPYSDFSSVMRSNELLRTTPGVVAPLGVAAA